MLHILVNTHTLESCAFRSEEHAEVIVGGAARLAEVCEAHDATLSGIWVNRAAHKFFALIDAPTAHVIDDVIVECGWVGHTDSGVFAVTTMDEARASAERQQAAR